MRSDNMPRPFAPEHGEEAESQLQRDIEAIDIRIRLDGIKADEEAWQRIRARLTPDRERVFAAITETLIRFGHDDATMLQDCIFAADAAIAAMEVVGHAGD